MVISIIGLGLLGGSFALGLKSKRRDIKFIGVDANPEHAHKALTLGIADEVIPLEQAVGQADVTVLATPVNVIVDLLPTVLDLLPTGAFLIDFGSTKEQICRTVQDHPKRGQFVACHPMAGTEHTGPEAAFAGLFSKKTMIICEKEKSQPAALSLVESLYQGLEMNICYMDAAEHDQQLAFVSHLSHISSFALSNTVLNKQNENQHIFDMAGSGFSSTVRLAKSSPQMWAPIFTQNKKNISAALESYIQHLQAFKEAIDAGDEDQSKELMFQANEIRRILG